MSYLRSDNEEDLLMKLALYFQTCGTELLVIDEVEHIHSPQLKRRLLEVSNLAPQIPMVCASCHPTSWVSGDAEVAGRWNDYFELRQYTGDRLRQLLGVSRTCCSRFPNHPPSRSTRWKPTRAARLHGTRAPH